MIKLIVMGSVLAYAGIAHAQELSPGGTLRPSPEAYFPKIESDGDPEEQAILPEAEAEFLPRSLSEFSEPAPGPKPEGGFSIGIMGGYLKQHAATRGTWLVGVQGRFRFLKYFAVEASISGHDSELQNGDQHVIQYPVQLTAMFYLFPESEFRPYILGGVGWYYTRVEYSGALSATPNTDDHVFGEHFGAGLELIVGKNVSIDGDIRYIFQNPSNAQVRNGDWNYWQVTFGINLFF
jgi:opacity protein-like surface antigen